MIRSSVIPTRRSHGPWLPTALIAISIAVFAAVGVQVLAGAHESGAYEAGYEAGIEQWADTVGGAYSTGYQAGTAAACPANRHGAPL